MADPIEHVVVLMLANNSFDRMLGCMTDVYPNLAGVNNAHPFTNPGHPDTTHLFAQLPNNLTAIANDPGHDLDDVLRQIGNNDCQGFVADFAQKYPQANPDERYQIMGYFPLNNLPVLHTLARSFLVCDHWYSSVPGPTWPNRFFVHSGTSLGHTDMPGGIFRPDIHLYNQPTVFQRLSEQNVSWRIYYGDVPQSLVMTEQLRYRQLYRHMDQFSNDVIDASSFPQYVFIEPSYFGVNQNDQHPPTDVAHGEALIAQIYNALRQNEELWQSTLFVLLYDEHGGFCDHVPPPPTVAPDSNTKSFAFNLLGLRVPAVLISPWLDAGVLSTVFDHTSLLKYLTDKWGLGPLGARVPQANSFAGALSTRTSGRTDCPASLVVPVVQPNDLNFAMNAHQIALAGFTQHLEATTRVASEDLMAAPPRAVVGDDSSQSHSAPGRAEQFLSPTTSKVRDLVFVSYSHKDKRYLDELLVHLKPLQRAGRIAAWSDHQIQAGSKWFDQIKQSLADAKVVIMLVSSDFLASDFIDEHELGDVLKKAESGGVLLLWFLVRPCAYKESPLKDYQAAINPSKALSEMRGGRDKAWVTICEEIKKAVSRPDPGNSRGR